MTDGKARRLRAIAEIIRSGSLSRQEQLAERLAERGIRVTQATVSRDLEELGAIKIRRDGTIAYAMPDAIAQDSRSELRLAEIVREWVRSIEPVGNLIVLKTPPGSAHLVGVALDQAQLDPVVGTICGDDTIFIALRDSSAAKAFASRLSDLTA